MSKPTFSILTPTYNCSNFILRSYHSLTSQTNSDWEWIIIDDGSEDDTSAVVKSIADCRIKYFNYEVNKGRGFARNFGISKCSGEVVVVWDIDDIYLEERLQNIYNEIIIEKFDFMVSQAIVVDNSFNVKGIRGFSKDVLFTSFVHPTLAFRRVISEKINYDQTMRAGEDLLLMIQLTNLYHGKYLNKNLMLYFEDREVNLAKTMEMHDSHTLTIHRILKEKFVNIPKFKILYIKMSLFIKKTVLKIFLLKPSLYLLTVKFRAKKRLSNDDSDDVLNIIDRVKINYTNL